MGLINELLAKYEYYNAPEGQDPLGKVIGFGKWGFTAGMYIGLYDACMISKTVNAKQYLSTTAFWVVPLTGMCVTFSSVVYILNQVRKKDDHINYVIGTICSGYIFNQWCKNPHISVVTTMLACLVAMAKKDNERYGRQKIFEPPKSNRWMVQTRNLPGYSLWMDPVFKHDKEDYYVNF